MIDPLKYRPLLFSERVEPNDVGKFDLCLACTLLMSFDAATLGEWTKNPNGTNWGKAKIKKALERARAATGEELRGAYNQSHLDDFLRGVAVPDNIVQLYNRPMSDIKQSLKDGYTVGIAGDVKHTPANSPLRKYVNGNVGHAILLTRILKDGSKIAFIDPMTPHGTKKYERWAPANDFFKFMSEFRVGKDNVAFRLKRGKYTQAREVARDRARLITQLQERIVAIDLISKDWKRRFENKRDQVYTLQGIKTALEEQIAELESQLGSDLSENERMELIGRVIEIKTNVNALDTFIQDTLGDEGDNV